MNHMILFAMTFVVALASACSQDDSRSDSQSISEKDYKSLRQSLATANVPLPEANEIVSPTTAARDTAIARHKVGDRLFNDAHADGSLTQLPKTPTTLSLADRECVSPNALTLVDSAPYPIDLQCRDIIAQPEPTADPEAEVCPEKGACVTACAEASATAVALAFAQASATACAFAEAWACVFTFRPFTRACSWARSEACATAFASAFAIGFAHDHQVQCKTACN